MIAPGIHKVLYVRKAGEATDAAKLLLQTEHSKSLKRDRDSTETKDGAIKNSGSLEDDPVAVLIEDSIIEDFPIEIWEVDLLKPNAEGTKFDAEYRQGYMTEWEETNPASDDPEYEGEFSTFGIRKKGQVTITKEDMETLDYVFHDVLAADPADDGLVTESASSTETTTDGTTTDGTTTDGATQ